MLEINCLTVFLKIENNLKTWYFFTFILRFYYFSKSYWHKISEKDVSLSTSGKTREKKYTYENDFVGWRSFLSFINNAKYIYTYIYMHMYIYTHIYVYIHNLSPHLLNIDSISIVLIRQHFYQYNIHLIRAIWYWWEQWEGLWQKPNHPLNNTSP